MTARYTMTAPTDELLPKTEAFPDWEPASHTCCMNCGSPVSDPEQGFFCSDICRENYTA
jgi:hypothetical protein